MDTAKVPNKKVGGPSNQIKEEAATNGASSTKSENKEAPNSNQKTEKKASVDSDSDDDKPLSTLKAKTPVKNESNSDAGVLKKKNKRRIISDDESDAFETPKKPATEASSNGKGESKDGNGKQTNAKETPAKTDKPASVPVKKTAPAKPATPVVKKEVEVKKEGAATKAEPVKRKREEIKESVKQAKTPVKKSKKEESDSSSSSDESSSSDDSSSSSDSDSSDDSSSSSDSSDSGDDVPLSKLKTSTPKKTPAKKAPAKKAKETPKKRATPVKKEKQEGATPKKTKKEGETTTPKRKKKEDETPQYKWWLAEPLPEGKKWRSLSHNGVVFTEPYKAHGVKMLYNGKPVDLTPEQEELATYYSQYLDSDHVKKPQFNKNFFSDWKKVLSPQGKPHLITDFNKCDFTPIQRHLMEQKEERKNRSKEDKAQEKAEKDKATEKYGWAMVDGFKQKISNFRVEPPGLFLGRGDHPLAGKVKRRVLPEDVTLNLGDPKKPPECPLPGHKWGNIVSDDTVAWLAFWKDINDNFKYVWLAPSSRVKGEADMKKFETARKLKTKISKIRAKYTKELTSDDDKVRQRATALYVIDHLALRVGNEKDEDEADTVGCCSLRVEHVTLKAPKTIEFDFLGKDSMRYQNSVEVEEQVFKNFKKFTKGKKKDQDIFDELTTSALNAYLKDQMEGLTAKVFRTYNASITLENELAKLPEEAENWTVDEKMLFYNRANREVAILCNHQRTVGKNFGAQIGKLDSQIQELEDQKTELKDHIKVLKGETPKKRKREIKEEEEEEGETPKKKQKLPNDVDKCKKAIVKLDERIAKWNIKKQEKDDLKTVALTTSKINYIDPRVSVSWAKKYGVPIEKIFSKTLREKFPWAMDVEDFVF